MEPDTAFRRFEREFRPSRTTDTAWRSVLSEFSLRRRRSRLIAVGAAACSLGLVVAGTAVLWPNDESKNPAVIATSPTEAPAGTSVTFTDGTRVTLQDRSGVLEGFALVSITSGACRDDSCAPTELNATTETVDSRYDQPPEPIPGAPSTVLGLALSPAGLGQEIVFQFGRWLVSGHTQGMASEDIQLWATSLSGRETDDGFLILDSAAPITLASAATAAAEGTGVVPSIRFSNAANAKFEVLTVFPVACEPTEDDLAPAEAAIDGAASTCTGGGTVVLNVQGNSAFVDDVFRNVTADSASNAVGQ